MKKYVLMVMMSLMSLSAAFAQSDEGFCGEDVKWTFDGYNLTISNVNKKGLSVVIDEYDLRKNLAPWTKGRLNVKKLIINEGITRIGSCAFANLKNLQEVVFEGSSIEEIGWGAFLNCSHLRVISLPINLKVIETIAFANCSTLSAIKLPDQCRVGAQAFVSCTNLKAVELSPTTILDHYVFASEVKIDNITRHSLYSGDLHRVPSYINVDNCHEYGLSVTSVEKATQGRVEDIDYDYVTSEIDNNVPVGDYTRNNTYALIIGNQNYRWVANVPYAIHDARVFKEYCQKTLGIPAANINEMEDATKYGILDEALNDWLSTIPDREDKNLIVYYAGHGVPDVKNKNKAYLLPTDVRGTNPRHGIALDEFYEKLGDLAFNQTSVFLDACFSGVNRDNEGVSEGLRGVEIEAEEASFSGGSVVVFSAAQGNETAQGYPEQGHGLFTYYLIKEIQETNGFVTYGELSDRIKANVSQQALQLKMRKKQTPATNSSEQLADTWRTLQF